MCVCVNIPIDIYKYVDSIVYRLNPASSWATGYDRGGHSYHPEGQRPEGDMN